MSYQVLARKYRPRTFDELVGQEHVSRALMHALDQDRLHHAYLFTGTRGVGKTTIARILSRCLNCEQGVSARPCGVCPTCQEITDGRFVDLIEVDAASRTKVEDTRELLDNVQYAPTRGRYKVYLIDEVHMLSAHSFNALLKTLEEPPPHVKFLLATTDPQKLPVTVLSRCLQFSLKALPAEQIAGHLKALLDKEMIRYEEPALLSLGKAAQGSMRDALSLTDQAIAFGSEQLSSEAVNAMLGTVDRNHVLTLLVALAEQEPGGVLQALATVSEHCPGELALLDELISQLHQLAVCQAVPGSYDETQQQLAAALTAEQIQLYYDVALRGRRDLQDAPDSRAALEMLLLRMVLFTPKGVLVQGDSPAAKKPEAAAPSAEPGGKPDLRALLNSPAAAASHSEPAARPPVPAPATVTSAPAQQAAPVETLAPASADDAPPWDETPVSASPSASAALAQVETHQAEPVAEASPVATPAQSEPGPDAEPAPEPENLAPLAEPTSEAEVATWWAALLLRLDVDGTVRNIARNAVLISREESVWTLRISPGHQVLVNKERLEELSGALGNYFQRRIQVQVEFEQQPGATPEVMAEARRQELLAQAKDTLHADPVVQQLVTTFAGRLDEESVTPKETVE
ncbi:AAA family ATPase [Alcanivorax sp. HI0083]|uniref:DNA polymerase III subunit gamma/tau n=1 Tax=unclassified Alcanivorax TaxID=2638842 RepID=UPI0007B9C95D|nr:MULTISPECIES: DNA polymerase III subunit gamma/tau [unclassified Alcanivorax]KZY33711.1 AAA family ATPase [Alcanivorax sp. HI0044]KZZ28677.1 AAA family ATPase [Alcanivorax sp. HI0083]